MRGVSEAVAARPVDSARRGSGREGIPASLLAVGLASLAAALLAGDWIAGAALWVLWAGWWWLPRDDGPPVLPLAFTFQWVQVTAGVYYLALTGRPLLAVYGSDYRTMVLIGLGCLLALLTGLALGTRLVSRRRPAAGTPLLALFGWPSLIACYAGSIAMTGTLQEMAWRVPELTQGILALTCARFAVVFLMFRRLAQPRIRWGWIGALLAVEVVLGFTGYFAGFREPMMMAAVALMSSFDRRKLAHWVTLAGLATAMVATGVLWIGIRTEFRQEFQAPDFAESREARAQRVADLSARWMRNTTDQMLADIELFVERLWVIYYPALALDRVPALLPHEDGAILAEAPWHLLTPRVLFPDKGVLPSDSEMVRKYAGVLVAGVDENTSIAFGYAAESYVDFGLPWMFLPVLVFGALMGMAYHGLLRLIRHEDLGVAVVTVVFWLSLSLFERSWVKLLGLSLTLIAYLGGAALVLDRVVLWRRAAARPGGAARAAWLARHRG